nr:uncharacterized protein LOC116427815 [Nomia melanderi]
MCDTIIDDLAMSYTFTISAVVVSFALNLCRVFSVVTEGNKLDEAVVPTLILIAHFILAFMTNHCGQVVIDTSTEVSRDIYNALWYYVPVKSQKLLLFLMMKTSDVLQIDIAGLYIAGYEGFSMMLSSSFSYFTVLYSTRS